MYDVHDVHDEYIRCHLKIVVVYKPAPGVNTTPFFQLFYIFDSYDAYNFVFRCVGWIWNYTNLAIDKQKNPMKVPVGTTA